VRALGDWATASLGAVSGANPALDQLAQEHAALRAENATLVAKVADLTALLGTRTEPFEGILAGVLARPPVSPYDTLLVDQGSDDGVGLGARVYGPGGTPIGAVTEVLRRSAQVTLYSTRGSLQYGWAGANRTPVELSGAGSGGFFATAPRDAGLVPGDGVYLAHGGALPIGVVVELTTDPSAPLTEVHVRPFTNPFSLTWVTIAPVL
jgi:cell shape-determining protein MreC